MSNIAGISDPTYDAFLTYIKSVDENIIVKPTKFPTKDDPALLLQIKDDGRVSDDGKDSFQRMQRLAHELRKVSIENHIVKSGETQNVTELKIKTGQSGFEDKLKKLLGIEAQQGHSATDHLIAKHMSNIRQMTRDTILANSERQPVDTEFAAKVYAQTIEGLTADARIMGVENAMNALLSKGSARGGRQ